MSRPLRIEYPGAVYHVMNRGQNRQLVFFKERDRDIFYRCLSYAAFRYKIKIHAFSLMPNHYHLLIETPVPNLHRAMRLIDGVYTQTLNKKYNRDGPLFKGRYKSILVQKEEYFLELVRYIHLNGTKALLFPNPGQDMFSSHRWYLFPTERQWWLHKDTVMAYFLTHTNPTKALHDFVQRGIKPELEDKLDRKRWPAILGTKDFIESIKMKYIPVKSMNNEHPEKTQVLLQTRLDPVIIDSVLDRLSAAYRLTQRERKWVLIFLLKNISELSYAEIAGRLGGKSYSSIHKFLSRHQFSNSPLLTEALKELKVSNVQT